MGLETYGDGNAISIIICDDCRRAVTTTTGAMSTADFEKRAQGGGCILLLGHASLLRAHAFTSGWTVDDAGEWRCGRCATGVRRKVLPDASGGGGPRVAALPAAEGSGPGVARR